MTASTPEPIALSLIEAARMLGTSVPTLKAEIAAGRLPARRLGQRTYVSRALLIAWAAGVDLSDAAQRQAIISAACAGAPAVNVAAVAAPLPEADQPATVREIAALLGESLGAALRQAVEPGQPAGRRRP